MTTLRTAAQQALEAMQTAAAELDSPYTSETPEERVLRAAITALRAQLAQEQAEPVQEPYCYIYEYDGVFGLHREFYPRPYNGMKPTRTVPVYTAPPKLVPLTDGALMGVYIDFDRTADPAWSGVEYLLRLCRTVERAHGIGGQDGR